MDLVMENDYSYSVHSDILNGDVDIYPMFDKDAVVCKYYYNDDKELRFPTIDDETIFWNRFEECVVSFFNKHPNDGVILIPRIYKRINFDIVNKTHIHDIITEHGFTYIAGRLHYISVEIFMDVLFSEGSYLRKYCEINNIDFDDEYNRIEGMCDKIEVVDDGYEPYQIFDYHYFTDENILNAAMDTLDKNEDCPVLYNSGINGKHLLLIDSSISSSIKIKECLDILSITYRPKSVSVLTMFSSRNNIIDHFRDFDSPYNK